MKHPPLMLAPIGTIHSPHTRAEDTPIQPGFAAGCTGCVDILPEYVDGLADIDGFSHIYLIYWLHRTDGVQLRVRPFLDTVERGIFATRAPCRPNPLGMSLVRLVRREGAVLHISGVDVLDGTPLLDIKPYAPRYDTVDHPRGGWTDDVDEATAQERGRRGYVPKHSSPKTTHEETP